MLTAHHISKSYGPDPILKDMSLSINPADRVGLIGPNGSGKTTLLRILAGQEKPDSGTVQATQADLRIGYLRQGFNLDPSRTIGEICNLSTRDLESVVSDLASALTSHPEDPDLQAAYDEALQAFESKDVNPANILASLGLD